MRFLVLLWTLSLSAWAQPAPANVILETRGAGAKPTARCEAHHLFRSAALAREMGYCLLLPRDYEKSKTRYPVLYLLHGLYGSENDWLARTKVATFVQDLPLIVVMPQADDSWYTNSATLPAAKYEDYAFEDLIREIDSHYRTIATRDGRFIAGLSMGGYGAMKAGLRHPEMYAAVGGFSGLFHATRLTRYQSLAVAFGPPNDVARMLNDDFLLLGSAHADRFPYFFIMTGTDDDLALDDSRDFAAALKHQRTPYEYHEVPGKHEWPVWERCLRMFLDVIRPQLAPKMG